VALTRDGELIAHAYQHSGLTHSRTLLPMVNNVLTSCGESMEHVDVVAVAAGPGSFTGLRIGVATAKGLAWAGDKDCAPCSTLESMAWPLAHMEGKVIVCAMDARRAQVYNAIFLAEGGSLRRLSEDRAISLAELAEELKNIENEKIVVGDGAKLCYNTVTELGVSLTLAPEHLRMQSGWGVARAAMEMSKQGQLIKGAQLNAVYHRLSQAERERLEKQKTT
jgi:tRNA threonylcarbamoyladenosine biosynthesis protein TsaB